MMTFVVGVVGAQGVVAAGHQRTAEAGAAALRRGGNAFDATIAALAMACVCEPVLCAPGAGGFAMIRDAASGETTVLDFFAHTPIERRHGGAEARGVDADFGTATQAFHIGPATVATPGFFDGIEAIHASRCDDDARPAGRGRGRRRPRRCRGHPVPAPSLPSRLDDPHGHRPCRRAVRPRRRRDRRGRHVPQPRSGRCSGTARRRRIPWERRRASVVCHAGSRAGACDRSGSRCLRDHPAAAAHHRHRRLRRAPQSVAGGRRHVGRPLARPNRFGGPRRRRTRARRDRRGARQGADGSLVDLSTLAIRQRGTTQVSVVDASGTACAVTVSNGEGNGELVDGFGFMFNNILGEDDVNPAGLSAWPLDTRLSSMMCPTIIEHPDGGITALGSGGSNRIRSAIAQVVARLCLDGEDLPTAVGAPRVARRARAPRLRGPRRRRRACASVRRVPRSSGMATTGSLLRRCSRCPSAA